MCVNAHTHMYASTHRHTYTHAHIHTHTHTYVHRPGGTERTTEHSARRRLVRSSGRAGPSIPPRPRRPIDSASPLAAAPAPGRAGPPLCRSLPSRRPARPLANRPARPHRAATRAENAVCVHPCSRPRCFFSCFTCAILVLALILALAIGQSGLRVHGWARGSVLVTQPFIFWFVFFFCSVPFLLFCTFRFCCMFPMFSLSFSMSQNTRERQHI